MAQTFGSLLSKDKFLELKRKGMVYDVSLIQKINPDDHKCESCIYGKQTRLSSKNTKDKTYINRPLQIIHSDICGPITPLSLDGSKYFMIFVDQFTHYCVTYLAKFKSDLPSILKDYVNKSQSNFNSKVVHLYIDNGTEYLSNEMKKFCIDNGISYHLTIPHTPHQNGVSERMIRSITEKARTLLIESKLPQQFWGEAVITATFLINITPSRALKSNKTPFEMWHNKKPILKYLRIFGSTVFVHNKIKANKFETKSTKAILVGYVPNGYKVFDAETNTFYTARDVVIDEVSFLNSRPKVNIPDIRDSDESSDWLLNSDKTRPVGKFKEMSQITTGKEIPEGRLKEINEITSGKENLRKTIDNNNENRPEGRVIEINENTPEDIDSGGSFRQLNETISEYNKIEQRNKITSGCVNTEKESQTSELRQGKRLINEHENAVGQSKRSKNTSESNIENNIRRSNRNISRPRISYNENENIYDYVINRAECFASDAPNCFQEIQTRDDKEVWMRAVQDELDSLHKNNTWTFVTKPPEKNIIDCRWVFNVKTDGLGNPVRHKARLVAKGFSQEHLVDYFDTFAPIVRISSLRFLIAISNQFNLYLHHMDVNTAFLNGILSEEVYMKIPEGIVVKNRNLVCKLHKALYGLKQSARCWYQVFETFILKLGFKNSAVDSCVFIKDNNNVKENIYIALFVDDIFIATGDINSLRNLKLSLSKQFSMKDLEEIKYFLGIRVIRDYNTIKLDQTSYINEVLRKFNMYNCNTVKTPLPEKLDFVGLNADEIYNAPSQNLLGCLMYIMICTRPDLSFTVNILSRYSNKKNQTVWKYLQTALRYLKGTSDLKLVYQRNNNQIFDSLQGYADSDWAGDEITRISTTGYIFKLFEKCSVTWNTRKQHSVADSSTAAEYMALHEAVKEALWLRSLGQFVKVDFKNPIIIYEDNNGCIQIANNPTDHKRTKHIDIKYHFTREQVQKGIITLRHISTEEQIADIFTKSLGATKFMKLRHELGLE